VRLDDRSFGIPRRATASRPAPRRIYKPRRSLNDISVLSKSCHGLNLGLSEAVIWRMSVESQLVEKARETVEAECQPASARIKIYRATKLDCDTWRLKAPVLPEHACPQNPAGCARRRTRRGSCGRLNAGICAGLSPSKENRDVIRAPQADTARYASAIERGKTTIWECPSFSSVRRAGHGDWSTSRMISVLSDRCKPREMCRRKPSVWTRGLPGGTQATLASVSPAHCLARSRLTLAVRLYGAVGQHVSAPASISLSASRSHATSIPSTSVGRHRRHYARRRRRPSL
jgi:hypothetical protein